MADAPITFFVPLGEGRSNPGLTLRAESIEELEAVLDALNLSKESEESQLSRLLNHAATIKAGVDLVFPPTVAQAPKPAVTHPQAQSNPSDAPSCPHGSMTWRVAKPESGKDWKGWFCPAPYGVEKCKPRFVK